MITKELKRHLNQKVHDEYEFVRSANAIFKTGSMNLKLLMEVLAEESFPKNARQKVAQSFFQYEPVICWSFANFDSDGLEDLCFNLALTEERVSYAAINPNWTAKSILTLKVLDYRDGPSIMTSFLLQLPDEVLKKVLVPILTARHQSEQNLVWASRFSIAGFARSVDKQTLFKRARKIYDLDDDFPDEWLLKAVGVPV